jgi:hypothetical protein
MSCIIVSINRKGESINTLISKVGDPFIVDIIYNKIEITPIIHRVGGSLNITTEYKNTKLNISCGILCSVGTIRDDYELFEANDGDFILYDGESYKVLRENGI